MLLFLLLLLNLPAAFTQAVCDGTTTYLDLSNRSLTTLPDLSLCSALTELNLRNNQLTTLAAGIGQLVNLQILSFSYNQLTTLPTEIGQLVNLQSLHLHNNQLTTLPAEIGQLANLLFLPLDNNPIICLPAAVRNHATIFDFFVGGFAVCMVPTTSPTASTPSALVRPRLPPFTELYHRASFPATISSNRNQPAATIPAGALSNGAQSSGRDTKSKLNEMKQKVAAMRGEL